MRILFVHQNMPAQYAHLAAHYAADPRNEVVFLTRRKGIEMPGVRTVRYDLAREPRTDAHHYVKFLDEHLLYGQAVVRAAVSLKNGGFRPDVICAHSGWGEAMFLKDVYPDTPLLVYAEYYYRGRGADVGFESDREPDLDIVCRSRARNAHMLLSLEAADWAVTPTLWQWRQQPAAFRPRISVIHDGIRTQVCTPDPAVHLPLPNGTVLTRDDEVVTYLSRNLEPYRGFDRFMRALPELLKRRPKAHVVLVGGDESSYGGLPADFRSWREKLLAEVRIDPHRVHFLGRVPYDYYLRVLRVSRVHTYLTYPFVLSWSMLESMSTGCCLVASATPPVQEVLRDGETGAMVDYFDGGAMVDRICTLLDDPETRERYAAAARGYVVENYDLETVCLPQQVALIERVASGNLPRFSSTAIAEGFPGAPPELA
ncbi:glycosyl transferase [Thalassobaculum fulvum]|uniref:Glycosyl transferase n=1 Tax=Thalassobaculum fulvum TaxID=1633335 RepID=A0A919CQY0_9PROT|nr:glycosyltransferase family 4 protein [Thalassobaculum fulvum]GHD57347.1 glycosyl transferase [Thalassobaculum fulvum]